MIATLIEGAWEIFENTPFIINRYRTQTISRDYFGDTIVNSVGDMLAMMVGLPAGRAAAGLGDGVPAIATEVVLLGLIRDNLTLNIIMLIYPMEGIRQLQMASLEVRPSGLTPCHHCVGIGRRATLAFSRRAHRAPFGTRPSAQREALPRSA